MLQVRKTKKVLANFPRGFWRFPTKFQLFKKECCPRAEDRPIFEDLRLRGQGQGQGLDLRGQGQGQGLQNVSSRTSSRPRTSSRTPPLLITLTEIVMIELSDIKLYTLSLYSPCKAVKILRDSKNILKFTNN